MEFDQMHEILRYAENTLKSIGNRKMPDENEFLEEKKRVLQMIEELRKRRLDEEKLKNLQESIQNNKKVLEEVIQRNFEKNEEIARLDREIQDFEKKTQETIGKYDKKLEAVEVEYHEEMLKNIEQRNYIQKLKILQCDRKKRKSRN